MYLFSTRILILVHDVGLNNYKLVIEGDDKSFRSDGFKIIFCILALIVLKMLNY